jgi:hypothetical protein
MIKTVGHKKHKKRKEMPILLQSVFALFVPFVANNSDW